MLILEPCLCKSHLLISSPKKYIFLYNNKLKVFLDVRTKFLFSIAPMNNIFPLHEIVCLEEHYGQKRANAFPPTKTNTYRLSNNSNMPKNTYLPPQEHVWFNTSSISQFERNALSCLLDDGTTFKGTITDDEYLRIRNEIINEYKECLVFMSLSYVYSKFGGSMNNIMKIFSFLEKQNIINNRNLIEECKTMVDELYKDTKESIKDKEPVKDLISQILDEISNDDLNKSCKCSNPASYLNGDKIYICTECYDKGFYDQKYTSSDFSKLDEESIKKKWSKMEEIKLLEAVDNFGDDWKRVAEHVETKNAHECVRFFVNMAIQEKNLDSLNFSIRVPFVKTPNPVMYLISFITSVVHPTLGSIAAHEAMINVKNSSISVVETILKKVKTKAMELIDLENKKIKRIDDVLEEAMLNLISLKTRSYKELCEAEEKVKQELINLRIEVRDEQHE